MFLVGGNIYKCVCVCVCVFYICSYVYMLYINAHIYTNNTYNNRIRKEGTKEQNINMYNVVEIILLFGQNYHRYAGEQR